MVSIKKERKGEINIFPFVLQKNSSLQVLELSLEPAVGMRFILSST